MDVRTFLLLSAFFFNLNLISGQTLEQSKNLMSTMLTGYDKRQRPILDQSKSVNVTVSFDIVAIQDFNEVEEKFSVVGVLYLSWIDESIKWDPFSNGGIFSQLYQLDDVWYPILILGNPFNSVTDIADDWMTVRILFNGVAFFSPGAVFKATCSVDVTYYPFDTQTCTLLFIPWGFSDKEMRLISDRSDVLRTYYSENGEWILDSTTAVQETLGDFDTITFTFNIKRKPLFLVINVILPIIFMAVINILVFILPVESGERVSYAVTVLLAIAVFLTLVGDNLPKTSEPMSVLCYFLMLILIISTLMCVITILNLYVYHNKRTNVPSWCVSMTRVVICKRFKLGCKRRNQIEMEQTGTNVKMVDLSKDNDNRSKRVVAFAEDFDDVLDDVTWKDVSSALDRIFIVFFMTALTVSVSVYLNILVNNKPAGT